MSKGFPTAVISAFTEEQVERLTGISVRQLRHWHRTNFFLPSLSEKNDDLLLSRLYSFRDLVSLKVLNALRNDASVSLQHLREVKEKLAHLGDELWSRTTLWVLNKRVVFENPETKTKEEIVTGQGVLQIPLVVVTGDMQQAVSAMKKRKTESIGQIETKRGIMGKQPVVAGTRIPVSAIKDFSKAGYTVEQIQLEYPTLTEEDIRAAIKYKDAA